MKSHCFLITCEHGGNACPPAYANLFASPGARRDLLSHRGHDVGSLQIGHQLSQQLNAELIASQTTRLLVDLNRSRHHPQLFSKYTARLPEPQQAALLDAHYHPYRRRVEGTIHALLESSRRIVHLSVHTFTPRFRGLNRPLEIGILYDPKRREESRFSEHLISGLKRHGSRLRVRHNEPYLGTDDGFTTQLRTQYASPRYLGLEIEINNRYVRWQPKQQHALITALVAAIQQAPVDP
ncbi:MAG: N-formylglutamate amidohydrolase [Novipirellula sp. JB048]